MTGDGGLSISLKFSLTTSTSANTVRYIYPFAGIVGFTTTLAGAGGGSCKYALVVHGVFR